MKSLFNNKLERIEGGNLLCAVSIAIVIPLNGPIVPGQVNYIIQCLP